MEEQSAGERRKFGDFIRERRLERGWSQERLAKEAGTTRTHINKIEKGRITLPRDPLLGRLTTSLGITGDQFEKMIDELSTADEQESSPEDIDPTIGVIYRLAPSEEAVNAGVAGLVMGFLLTLRKDQRQRLLRIVDTLDDRSLETGVPWINLITSRARLTGGRTSYDDRPPEPKDS